VHEWFIDRFLERRTGPDRPLPRWLGALLDETFLWVGIGQLLLALGLPATSVRRLSEVQRVLEEARASGIKIPRLEGVRTYGDLDRLGEQMDALADDDLTPEELERLVPAPTALGWMRDAGGVVLDLFDEVLMALRSRRLRTELVGIDHLAAHRMIGDLRRLLADPTLDRAAAAGHAELVRHLEVLDEGQGDIGADLEVTPVAPRPGEIQRVVTVVRAIPRETLDRLLPLRLLSSRPVLGTAIATLLKQLREGWVSPQERAAVEVQAQLGQLEHLRRTHRLEESRREVEAREARPEVRASLLAQSALLWLLIAMVVGWQAAALGAGLFGVGLGLPDRPSSQDLAAAGALLRTLLPVLALVGPAAFALSVLGVGIAAVDDAEIGDPRTRPTRGPLRSIGPTAPRRSRRRAARAGSVVSVLMILLPVAALLLAHTVLPDVVVSQGSGADTAFGAFLAIGLGIPWASTLAGAFVGSLWADRWKRARWSAQEEDAGDPSV